VLPCLILFHVDLSDGVHTVQHLDRAETNAPFVLPSTTVALSAFA
jgi:hypothetical protein